MASRFIFRAVGWLPLLSIGLWAAPAAAQGPWPPRTLRMELRGELAWPTGELADVVGGGHGYGWGIGARYAPVRPLTIYAGADRFAFRDNDDGIKTRLSDMGLRAGVQLAAPLGERVPVSPFVLGGVVYNWTRLKRTLNDGSHRVRTDPGLGYEAGGGVGVRITRRFWLVPEARYRSHGADVGSVIGAEDDLRVSYVALNLGLVIGL